MAKKIFKISNSDFGNQSIKSHKDYSTAIKKLPEAWRMMEKNETVNRGDAIWGAGNKIWVFWAGDGPYKQKPDELFARKKTS